VAGEAAADGAAFRPGAWSDGSRTTVRRQRPNDSALASALAEFWGRHTFDDFNAAATALRGWERTYNYERFSLALQGRTPAEKLAGVLPSAAA